MSAPVVGPCSADATSKRSVAEGGGRSPLVPIPSRCDGALPSAPRASRSKTSRQCIEQWIVDQFRSSDALVQSRARIVEFALSMIDSDHRRAEGRPRRCICGAVGQDSWPVWPCLSKTLHEESLWRVIRIGQ